MATLSAADWTQRTDITDKNSVVGWSEKMRAASGNPSFTLSYDWASVPESHRTDTTYHNAAAQLSLCVGGWEDACKVAEKKANLAKINSLIVRALTGGKAQDKRMEVVDDTLVIYQVIDLDYTIGGFFGKDFLIVDHSMVIGTLKPENVEVKLRVLAEAGGCSLNRCKNTAYFRNLVNSPAYYQPIPAVQYAAERTLDELKLEGDEEYVKSYYVNKVNIRGQLQQRLIVITTKTFYTVRYDFGKDTIDHPHKIPIANFMSAQYGKFQDGDEKMTACRAFFKIENDAIYSLTFYQMDFEGVDEAVSGAVPRELLYLTWALAQGASGDIRAEPQFAKDISRPEIPMSPLGFLAHGYNMLGVGNVSFPTAEEIQKRREAKKEAK
jgi:hypothetical protein